MSNRSLDGEHKDKEEANTNREHIVFQAWKLASITVQGKSNIHHAIMQDSPVYA